jgi:CheY-like chemotaxis protein
MLSDTVMPKPNLKNDSSLRRSVSLLMLDEKNGGLLRDDNDKICRLPQCVQWDPQHEYLRLEIVRQTGILDGDVDNDFDRLVTLCSRVMSAPVVIIAIMEVDRPVIVASKCRDDIKHFQRACRNPYCSYAILPDSPDVYVVDEFDEFAYEFFPKDFVFYASTPLVVDDVRIGTMVMLDTKKRKLSLQEKMNLLDLGIAGSDLCRIRRDNFVKLNQERANILLSMTSNLRHPLENIQEVLSSLREDFVHIDEGKETSLMATLTDFDRALGSLRALMETSLTFGRLLSQENKAREEVPCDMLGLLSDMQMMSEIYGSSEGHLRWTVEHTSFCQSSSNAHSFPDAILFSVISSLAELCPQWQVVRVHVKYRDKKENENGVYSNRPARTGRSGVVCIYVSVAESVSGQLGAEADLNSSSMRRDFSSIRAVLTEIEGNFKEEVTERGRSFLYEIPCVLHATNGGHTVPDKVATSLEYSLRVLVVDGGQALMSEWLTQCGCTVELVDNGRLGADLLCSREYDLVFLELLLPVQSGLDIMATYLQSPSTETKTRLPLIVGTAFNATETQRTACLAGGMHFFMHKPLHRPAILALVDAVQKGHHIPVIDLLPSIKSMLSTFNIDKSQGHQCDQILL